MPRRRLPRCSRNSSLHEQKTRFKHQKEADNKALLLFLVLFFEIKKKKTKKIPSNRDLKLLENRIPVCLLFFFFCTEGCSPFFVCCDKLPNLNIFLSAGVSTKYLRTLYYNGSMRTTNFWYSKRNLF